MDQPKGMRQEYTIMQGEAVYQADQIDAFAQQFGFADKPEVENVELRAFG